MAVAISALVQDVYPPRVAVGLTGITLTDEVTVYRELFGNRTALRSGYVESATDTGFIVLDAELPFGVPIRYVANVAGTEYATSLTTYDLPGGKVAITDAITGSSVEVQITAPGDRTYNRDSARLYVGGRTIVVSGPQGDAEGSYELFVETSAVRDNLMMVLATATQGVVQIRQPGVSLVTGEPYDGVDAYLAVDRITERRTSQDGSDPRRLITIEYAEVDAWPDALEARSFTYGEVEAYYSGISYATASVDFATYLDAMQGDFS